MVKRKFNVLPLQEASELALEDDVVKINRSSAVVKGGRRFSFSALSIVGNRKGVVGIGYGKGKGRSCRRDDRDPSLGSRQGEEIGRKQRGIGDSPLPQPIPDGLQEPGNPSPGG